MPGPRAAISWSGGKDGCAALHRVRDELDVVAMLTMADETGTRSRSHGLRPEVLAAQAGRLGLDAIVERCTWPTYEAAFRRGLARLRDRGVTHVVFGDIMFDDHKRWTERVCEAEALAAVQPLWGEPTRALFGRFLEEGGRARIVTVRERALDASWLGRTLEPGMADELERLGVDPCGERGEYHTVVLDTPLFRAPLGLRAVGRVRRGGCWALDLVPDEAAPC